MKKKKEKKVIYHYNKRFPEFGIEAMELEDVRYIKSVLTNKDLYLHSIQSYYNLDTMTKNYFPMSYELCNVCGNGTIYHWQNHFGNTVVMSFDKSILEHYWVLDCQAEYKKMQERMTKLEKCGCGKSNVKNKK